MKNRINNAFALPLIWLAVLLSFVGCINNSTSHIHDFQQKLDDGWHFKECSCGESKDRVAHTLEWVVDTEPTYIAPGYKHKECKACGQREEENTQIDRLLHDEVLSAGMIDMSSYTQKSFKSKYGIGNFLNDNQDKIGGICLSLDMSKVLSQRIYNQTPESFLSYTFGYKGEEGEKYTDYYFQTHYRIYSEELGRDDSEDYHSHSITVCLVSYGGYDKMGDFSFEFYKYSDGESIWNNLVKIFDGERCVAEMYYYTTLDIEREWVATFLSDAISEFVKNIEADTKEELHEAFYMIKEDAEENDKLQFFVVDEEIHYELKDSGEYDDCEWRNSSFIINVECNYNKATEEAWYRQCSQTDTESLNEAFYNCYGSAFSNGEYSNIVFAPGMHFIYRSLDDLNSDYSALKALTNLEFVTGVSIVYQYAIPYDYMEI